MNSHILVISGEEDENADSSDPNKKVVYKQPAKRSAEEMEGKKSKLQKEVTAKKVKNKSLLSFDDEEDDDDSS